MVLLVIAAIWIIVGILFGIVRWWIIEGPEKIKKANADRAYASTFNSDVVLYGHPKDWFGLAERSKQSILENWDPTSFWQFQALFGPLSILTCITGSDIYSEH